MQLSTIRHLGNEVSALAAEVTYKAKTPESADNQLLPTAPSWLDGMWRNVMVNGNQSKLLGSGGWRRGWGWKRMKGRMCLWSWWKLIPGLQILCLWWPAAEAASWHQWESQRTRVPWSPPPSLGSFYWISERNVYKMTTVLLKTEWGGKIGQEKKSNHAKWNESRALKVLAASARPNSSALSGNFLLYSQLVSIQTSVSFSLRTKH